MIQPLLKTEAKPSDDAAVFQTLQTLTETKIKRNPPLPLDSGTPDGMYNRKTFPNNDLRRGQPVSKPLDTGSLDEFHKPNSRNQLRRANRCPSLDTGYC